MYQGWYAFAPQRLEGPFKSVEDLERFMNWDSIPYSYMLYVSNPGRGVVPTVQVVPRN